MSEISTLEMLAKLIDEKKPKVVVDLGSGYGEKDKTNGHINDYFLPAAEKYPETAFIGIDNDYTPENMPKDLPNTKHIYGDIRNIPLEEGVSDITFDAGCSGWVLSSENGYKVFEEIHRITRNGGIGFIEVGSEFLQVLPKEKTKQKKLKELVNEAYRVGKISDEGGGYHLDVSNEKYSKLYDEIRKIVDVPMEDVMNSFGLQIIEKIPYDLERHEDPQYTYLWKKGEKKNHAPINLLGTGYKMLERIQNELGE